jgi:lysophospholipase L1-like esterase
MLKRVLCFGDSNTWGYKPEDGQRYAPSERWPGLLQSLLGVGYQIIEEGLPGRTTNIDYEDRFARQARNYLVPCLDSHYPLDFVILHLGANDMKAVFNRSASAIADAINDLIKIILGHGLERPSPGVKVILVGPSRVLEGLGGYGDEFKGATKKSIELGGLLSGVAERNGVLFENLFGVIEPSPIDGVHFTKEENAKIAQIFYRRILDENRKS